MSEPSTHNKGEPVSAEGDYVCVPCGYRKHFKPGEHFTECTSCFSGTPEGHEDFQEGMEMWEPLEKGNRKNDDAPGSASPA